MDWVFLNEGTEKTAATRIFWDLVNQTKWYKVRDALRKAGDDQSVKLWEEASEKLSKALTLKADEERALNRMVGLVAHHRPGAPPEGMRNQVFKIADELGIRLPSGMFASEKTANPNLPPFRSWDTFLKAMPELLSGDLTDQGRAYKALEHAIKHLRGYAATTPEQAAAHKFLLQWFEKLRKRLNDTVQSMQGTEHAFHKLHDHIKRLG